MEFYPIFIKTHIVIASMSLFLGIAVFFLHNTKKAHRYLGLAWLFCILFTVFSSFAIREINDNNYSILHLFSLWTLMIVCIGLLMLKRRKYHLHGKLMLSVTGGTLFAGMVSVLASQYYFTLVVNFVKNIF